MGACLYSVVYCIVRLLFPALPEANQMIHVFSEMVDGVPDSPLVLNRLDDLSWSVSLISEPIHCVVEKFPPALWFYRYSR